MRSAGERQLRRSLPQVRRQTIEYLPSSSSASSRDSERSATSSTASRPTTVTSPPSIALQISTAPCFTGLANTSDAVTPRHITVANTPSKTVLYIGLFLLLSKFRQTANARHRASGRRHCVSGEELERGLSDVSPSSLDLR